MRTAWVWVAPLAGEVYTHLRCNRCRRVFGLGEIETWCPDCGQVPSIEAVHQVEVPADEAFLY